MTEEYKTGLPAVGTNVEPWPNLQGRIRNALEVRTPREALTFRIQNRSTIAAINSQRRYARALASCINEHTKVIDAMDHLYTAMSEFQARQSLNFRAPEKVKTVEELEEVEHQSALAKKRREKELYEADRETLRIKHGLQAEEQFRDYKFEVGAARFGEKVAKFRAGEAVAREASRDGEILEPENKIASKPVSMAQTLAQRADELQKEIDEGEAEGSSTVELRSELKAVNNMLRRELLRKRP